MRLWTAHYKLTDGSTWCWMFRACDWSDAAAIADDCASVLDGEVMEIIDEE